MKYEEASEIKYEEEEEESSEEEDASELTDKFTQNDSEDILSTVSYKKSIGSKSFDINNNNSKYNESSENETVINHQNFVLNQYNNKELVKQESFALE
jgi:hypothetical protein